MALGAATGEGRAPAAGELGAPGAEAGLPTPEPRPLGRAAGAPERRARMALGAADAEGEDSSGGVDAREGRLRLPAGEAAGEAAVLARARRAGKAEAVLRTCCAARTEARCSAEERPSDQTWASAASSKAATAATFDAASADCSPSALADPAAGALELEEKEGTRWPRRAESAGAAPTRPAPPEGVADARAAATLLDLAVAG
jgi:hypothetical protein